VVQAALSPRQPASPEPDPELLPELLVELLPPMQAIH
jgi:hypothetical protein